MMTHTGNAWLLCTRTASKDYFWIGGGSEPTDLYRSVSDESGHRCGYFLAHGDAVEMGLNRLDADRRDNINRRIRHSLILKAKADGAEADFLRRAFAQAIMDGTPLATDSAAAALGRRLYAWWEESGSTNPAAPIIDWWDLAKDLAASLPESPAASNLKPNWYYQRSADILGRLAASANRPAPVLLLCAATNYTGRIIRSAEQYRSVPAIVCALEDAPSDGEPLSTHNERMRPAAKPKMKLWALMLAVVVIAVAVLAWLWLAKTPDHAGKTEEAPGSSIPTAPVAPTAESTAVGQGETTTVGTPERTGETEESTGSSTPAGTDELEKAPQQPGGQVEKTLQADKREQTVAPSQPSPIPRTPMPIKEGTDP
ncbi:MAG: hypothetical protein LBU23_10480 [Planctomycetota bacterium]|jgi:hypothetical protein|nr:hypothetical protein [Planctomycetota bacterium]